MSTLRNVAIVAALREVGAFADQPGTPGVNVSIAATACELDPWVFVRLADGSCRLAITYPQPLNPAYLDAARSTGLPLDVVAADLWARLSDAMASTRGSVLVGWACLSRAMRDVLAVILIGAPHRWAI